MLETIQQFDQELFYAINKSLSNPFFDWLMPLLRNMYTWFPLYIFLIVFLISSYAKKGVVIVVFLLLNFATTDIVASRLIKPSIQRLRPCNNPSLKKDIHILVNCGSGYSFPSAHATNHFGVAFFLITIFYKRWRWILPIGFAWAFSISFAQVYVGVHYPVDVTFGAFIGAVVGYLIGSIQKYFYPDLDKPWIAGS